MNYKDLEVVIILLRGALYEGISALSAIPVILCGFVTVDGC